MPGQVTMTCAEFLDLAAGLALDALDDDEVELVEQHAAGCADCGLTLREFRETAAALGGHVAQVDPPPALRERVLQAVHRAEQQRPPKRAWPRALRPRRVSPAWLVAAASFVISIGAITWVALLQGQIAALQADASAARERAARYDHVAEVLASDRLAIRPLQPVVQNMPSRGMVYMDPLSGTGMLMCRNMPPIEQGHAYQVWFTRGSERVSAGLLWPDRSGDGYALIQVPTDLQSFESIGLTDEPGTGSQWPTTPRVIGTQLT
ncbi:MAG: anti-sigma factor [Chloroflexi bacterium]|nr:anti-sigma factor [Chloroflexota bacterium]